MRILNGRPRARQKLFALFGVAAIISALTVAPVNAALATEFELDKNATNNLNVTRLGDLGASITANALSLNICRTAPDDPATPFTILINAERMTVTATATGNFGGNCLGTKRTYTITRGVDGTTAAAHSKGGVEGAISYVVAAVKDGPDWNQVHQQVQGDPSTTCESLGLVECTFIEDGIGPTTFIGGNTKDHIPVSSWMHTSGASPDKAEILNAYAAKAIDDNDDQILYFGMDRYAVDGSTDIGFWFFQTPVSTNPDGTFSGTQVLGDILALGTFTQGGAITNIRVFRWVGTGGNESGTIDGPDGTFGDCVGAPTDAPGCATVNDTTIEVPWTYTFKGSSTGKWVPAGGFFEGGVNLTFLGLDGCFSSFLAETRSSPEITAVLKDFALGDFEACDSGLVTTPGDGSGTALVDVDPDNGLPEISIGSGSVMVRDLANLTVVGTSTWSGTLSFYLCGPIASGLCDGTLNAGTQIGAAIPVDQDTAQPVQSAAATITEAGRYCWRGFFDSATSGVPDSTDARANECFEVLPVQPTITTNATNGPVAVAGTVDDVATLSGSATQPDGDPAGGTITFYAFGPHTDTVTCDTLAYTSVVNVSGNGNYTASTGSGGTFTPSAAGIYNWIAVYSGDSPNTLSVSGFCGDSDETSEVSPVTPTIVTNATAGPVTIGASINDTATLSGTANQPNGDPAGGTITFTAYGPHTDTTTCSDVAYTSVVNVSGDGNYSASSGTGGTFTPNSAGTYNWIAVYSGDAPNTLGASGACGDANEGSVVAPAQPTIVTNATAGPVSIGTSINDTATLSGTAPKPNGDPAGGTITFTAYGPHDDTTTCSSVAYTSVVNVNGDGNYTASSGTGGTFTPTAAGTYNWIAVYSGDSPNTLGATGVCGDANESSLVVSLQPTMDTAQSFVPNDAATITVASGGGNLAGSVVFQLFVNDATCAGPAAYTSAAIDITTGTGSGLSRTVMSSNSTAYTTSGTTFHWVVTYTSSNVFHENVASGCGNEHSSITIDNGVTQPPG